MRELKRYVAKSFAELFLGLFIVFDVNGASLVDWQQDLDFFAKALVERHPNIYHKLSKETFEAEVESLRADLPKLKEQHIPIRLQQITAKMGDLHTRVSWRHEFSYPIMFTQMGEDVYVTAVLHENMRHLLGLKLVGIEDSSLSEVLTMAGSLISAENKYAIKALVPSVLRDGEALQYLRISKRSDAVVYKFEDQNKLVEVQLQSVKLLPNVSWYRAAQNAIYSMSRPSEIYWYEYHRAEQAIYINYSRCEERKDFPFQSLVNAVASILSKEKVERVIIDLRNNPGGQENLILPLLNVLKNKAVKVSVLIGNRTFSSAFGNALTIKNQLNGILIGQPTGQKPNAFGEVKSFYLPHSRTEVHHSTKYWTRIKGSDPDALYPDVPLEMSFHQYTQGIDPVLQKALTFESER